MTARQPIDPADIKPGDLVRAERGEHVTEWRVGKGWTQPWNEATYYLLDRPAPAVDLPTEPTFGVLTWTAGPNTKNPGELQNVAADWYLSPCISTWVRSDTPTQVHAVGLGLQVPITSITAFTPATAVPTSALDELRRAAHDECAAPAKAIYGFLAAVDAANGTAS